MTSSIVVTVGSSHTISMMRSRVSRSIIIERYALVAITGPERQRVADRVVSKMGPRAFDDRKLLANQAHSIPHYGIYRELTKSPVPRSARSDHSFRACVMDSCVCRALCGHTGLTSSMRHNGPPR